MSAKYTYNLSQSVELSMDEVWILQDALDELRTAIDQKRSQLAEVDQAQLKLYRHAVQELTSKIYGVYCHLEDEAIVRGLAGDKTGLDGLHFPKLL